MNITLLWTRDTCDTLDTFSRFHSAFIAKQLEESVDFICCSRSDESIKTAYDIRDIRDIREGTTNVYVLPHISATGDFFRRKLQDSTWVLKCEDIVNIVNKAGGTKFEELCLPYIKDLLLVKNRMWNSCAKKDNFTVLMISDAEFLKNYFDVDIDYGQLYRQEYFYENMYDRIPSQRKNKKLGIWQTSSSFFLRSNSIKIFLRD
jgi:hypothetical protein